MKQNNAFKPLDPEDYNWKILWDVPKEPFNYNVREVLEQQQKYKELARLEFYSWLEMRETCSVPIYGEEHPIDIGNTKLGVTDGEEEIIRYHTPPTDKELMFNLNLLEAEDLFEEKKDGQ